MDITFYIGDGIEGNVFSSYNTSVTGTGPSETKAFSDALRNVKTDHPEYQSFVVQGKAKIINYFNTQCDLIIKEAKTLAGMQKYDEALWKLSIVPSACTDCWNKCLDAAEPIFRQKIDRECSSLIMEATNIWNSGRNFEAAQLAASAMSKINPASRCSDEAIALSEQIGKRIKEIDQRTWDFKYDKEITLRQDIIKAQRDIGVAYGEHQPQNITYKTFW
jgi:hypothetical protein